MIYWIDWIGRGQAPREGKIWVGKLPALLDLLDRLSSTSKRNQECINVMPSHHAYSDKSDQSTVTMRLYCPSKQPSWPYLHGVALPIRVLQVEKFPTG